MSNEHVRTEPIAPAEQQPADLPADVEHIEPPTSQIDTVRRDWKRWVLGFLGVAALAAAAVLLFRSYQKRNTPLSKAERALTDAASSLERAAKIIGKQGPGIAERGARQAESLARTVRKRGPAYVRSGGAQIEQFGRAIRTQGPDILIRGAERVEEAARTFRKAVPGAIADSAHQAEGVARTVRKQGPAYIRKNSERVNQAIDYGRGVSSQVAGYTSQAAEYSRGVGTQVGQQAQGLYGRAQNLFKRAA